MPIGYKKTGAREEVTCPFDGVKTSRLLSKKEKKTWGRTVCHKCRRELKARGVRL